METEKGKHRDKFCWQYTTFNSFPAIKGFHFNRYSIINVGISMSWENGLTLWYGKSSAIDNFSQF